MNLRTEELKNRVTAKRKQLEARLAELKADAQGKAADERDKLEARLAEIGDAVKDGWENLSERTAKKLNDLLNN